jgi:hypothetical protein
MKPSKGKPKAVKGPTGASRNQGLRATSLPLEEIRVRACEIYVERGRIDGRELEDWLQAEKQLTENVGKQDSD